MGIGPLLEHCLNLGYSDPSINTSIKGKSKIEETKLKYLQLYAHILSRTWRDFGEKKLVKNGNPRGRGERYCTKIDNLAQFTVKEHEEMAASLKNLESEK